MEIISVSTDYLNDVYFDNRDMGNIVEGWVSSACPKILFMPIPFRRGWNAFLDGKEIEIYKANYGFMAVYIPEGNHTIRFEYHNILFKFSLLISAFGFLLFTLTMEKPNPPATLERIE